VKAATLALGSAPKALGGKGKRKQRQKAVQVKSCTSKKLYK
jgi:hypothetical protein